MIEIKEDIHNKVTKLSFVGFYHLTTYCVFILSIEYDHNSSLYELNFNLDEVFQWEANTLALTYSVSFKNN